MFKIYTSINMLPIIDIEISAASMSFLICTKMSIQLYKGESKKNNELCMCIFHFRNIIQSQISKCYSTCFIEF